MTLLTRVLRAVGFSILHTLVCAVFIIPIAGLFGSLTAFDHDGLWAAVWAASLLLGFIFIATLIITYKYPEAAHFVSNDDPYGG